MYCPNCGAPNRENDHFCTSCGSTLQIWEEGQGQQSSYQSQYSQPYQGTNQEAPPYSGQQDQYQQPYQNQYQQTNTETPEEKRKKDSTQRTVLIVVLVIAGLSFIGPILQALISFFWSFWNIF